ncbi:MAG: GNAT family N-acetyltransferase [Chthoniobacterales bacterium]|nr:GNAT family N-acetyltransferase [Chthoniobacterales bacterium]
MSASADVILETERLRLRLVKEGDADFFLEILNEPAFIRFVADRGVRTRAEALDYIANKIWPSYTEFGFGFYITELKTGGEPVGMCGLVKRETLPDVDIGYSTLRKFWGRGYAFEAAAALMKHGREQLGIPRINGFTASDNVSSIKLLEKLGLRYEKTIQLPGYLSETMMFVEPSFATRGGATSASAGPTPGGL